MDSAHHVEDPRQRVADYAAVLVLTRAAAEDADLSIAQLGAIVAEFLPSLGPDALRAWSALDMAEAVRAIKLDLLRHRIAVVSASMAGPPGKRRVRGRGRSKAGLQARRTLSEQEISCLDDEISQSVVASFFKFRTMSALDPGWFAPHLAESPAF